MRGMCALLCVCFVFRGGFHSFGGGCLFDGNETSVRGFIRWTIRRFFSDPCSRISLPLVISSLVSIEFFNWNKFNLPKKYLKVFGNLFKLHFQVPEMVEITPCYGTPTQKKLKKSPMGQVLVCLLHLKILKGNHNKGQYMCTSHGEHGLGAAVGRSFHRHFKLYIYQTDPSWLQIEGET